MKTEEVLGTLSPTTRERALLIAKRLMRGGRRSPAEAIKMASELARRWAWRQVPARRLSETYYN
ncbi:hypothetical protein BWI93_09580 [Siphonobacter sp. BAB-5385]|uniref:hypothetical protein n=1 Tax=unclassified Siphonobacter TaxID=2635712 RepID=UPI000B9E86FE|nr:MULTISPECIES: hypothetical protein [unclassified Siphonobacter]OZI08360.1 hypothetical protein BWI93_09580 [Siphonobacter sp. BAB-5385]